MKNTESNLKESESFRGNFLKADNWKCYENIFRVYKEESFQIIL